jgi:polysaccharide export outer membrane protein
MWFRVLAVAVALFSTGCSKQIPLESNGTLRVTKYDALPPPTGADFAANGRPYSIGALDKLTVKVFGIEELSGKVQVDGSGRVAVPLAGSIEAGGMTPEGLGQEIERRLRARYVRDPHVTVNVDEALSQVVTIDGEVREPGLYPVVGNMTLLKAVATAKGPTEYAKIDDVVVFRTVGTERLAALYNIGAIRRGVYADPPIYPNDVVVVGDSNGRRMFKDLLLLAPLLTTSLIIALQRN